MGSINLLPEQVSHYRKIHEGGRLRSESAKCRAPLLKESARSYKAQIFGLVFTGHIVKIIQRKFGQNMRSAERPY